ncbi:MAG TPA: H-type lectin domain-containing protein [Candidatus Limnocylindria bacterium]
MGTIQLPTYDPMNPVPGTWTLNAGTGDRSYVSPDIPYSPPWSGGTPFASQPTVVVSLAGIYGTGGLTRVRLAVENVQVEEFNIRVSVAEDTTLNDVLVTWIATDGA